MYNMPSTSFRCFRFVPNIDFSKIRKFVLLRKIVLEVWWFVGWMFRVMLVRIGRIGRLLGMVF